MEIVYNCKQDNYLAKYLLSYLKKEMEWTKPVISFAGGNFNIAVPKSLGGTAVSAAIGRAQAFVAG